MIARPALLGIRSPDRANRHGGELFAPRSLPGEAKRCYSSLPSTPGELIRPMEVDSCTYVNCPVCALLRCRLA